MTARPTLLLRDGHPLGDALRDQRVTLDEVRQAVRSAGFGDLSAVAAVVLESDGSMSVVPTQQVGNWSSLQGIMGVDEPR